MCNSFFFLSFCGFSLFLAVGRRGGRADNEAEDFQTLQRAGIVVICYFSAGTYEEWRQDRSSFPASTLGEKVVIDSQFWGEWWLNINDEVCGMGVRERTRGITLHGGLVDVWWLWWW